jgi:GTP-binding protein
LSADPFIGRILTGRVESWPRWRNCKALHADGSLIETFRCTKILAFRGLGQQPIELAEAGDIVAGRYDEGNRGRLLSPHR